MDRWAELLLTVGGQGLSLAAGGGPAAPVEPDTCLGRGTEGRAQSLQGVGGGGDEGDAGGARDVGGRGQEWKQRLERSEKGRDHRKERLGRL